MPIISIKSLPLNKKVDIPELLKKLNNETAGAIGYEARHIWSYWQFIEPDYYAVGERLSETLTKESHSPIVEVMSFEGKSKETIKTILLTIAEVLSKGLEIDIGNIFIIYREAYSGTVFDGGEIIYKK
jgi:hypothetical protein